MTCSVIQCAAQSTMETIARLNIFTANDDYTQYSHLHDLICSFCRRFDERPKVKNSVIMHEKHNVAFISVVVNVSKTSLFAVPYVTFTLVVDVYGTTLLSKAILLGYPT